jgi:hypothetical protein
MPRMMPAGKTPALPRTGREDDWIPVAFDAISGFRPLSDKIKFLPPPPPKHRALQPNRARVVHILRPKAR